MTRVSDADLLALADLNLAESIREMARWCPAGEISERGDVLCAASASRFPSALFNTAMAAGGDPVDVVEQARAWFDARGRGFSVYARGARDARLEDRCRAAGLTCIETATGMVLDDAPAPVDGVERATDAAAIAAFVEVSIAAWAATGLGAPLFHKHFAAPARLLAPHVAVFLARDAGGAPAATSIALLSHGIAGIYWVGTAPTARKQGLGARVTAAASRWAFEQGARAVILQASVAGEPVYRRLGFRTVTRYPTYLAPRA